MFTQLNLFDDRDTLPRASQAIEELLELHPEYASVPANPDGIKSKTSEPAWRRRSLAGNGFAKELSY